MAVRPDRVAQARSGCLAVAAPPEGVERPRVGPEGGCIVLVLFEETFEVVVVPQIEEAGREQVADPLVVVGVEPEHLPVVPDRRLTVAHRPETRRKPHPGAHVGTGLEDPPEVAGVLFERLRAEGPLPGSHPLDVEVPRLLDRLRGLLGQEHVRVRAVGVDLERAPGEVDPRPSGRVPGLVHQMLRLAARSACHVSRASRRRAPP